jgi:predicted AAA+ superfamily ATPase
MAYLKRKIDDKLKKWKTDPNHLPLIIKGARQVGKTESIRHFAEQNYDSVIEINFITEPEYRAVTEAGFSADSVVRVISRINPSHRFLPGQTLIFFDEVQAFPEIATSLKFFREDGRFDVICSGSLLGIQYHRIDSISVGNKIDWKLQSMDFEEFLWGIGYGDEPITEMLQNMIEGRPFLPVEHNRYTQLFLEYCILGGMPKIVSTFLQQENFEGTLSLQRQLLLDYESDARKYAEGLDQAKIISAFRSIPMQLAKENKKFQYSGVAHGARAKDYLGCIEWLEDAGLVNLCRCMNFPELPIKGNVEENKFKVYLADTGLLIAALDDEAQLDLRANRNLGVYKGALYENFAAEALAKQNYELVYYKKENSQLEEDFFIRSANELIPMEVKAGSNQAKSMIQMIRSDHYPDICHGMKFTAGNIGITDNICSFPHYCLFLLRRYMQEQAIFR